MTRVKNFIILTPLLLLITMLVCTPRIHITEFHVEYASRHWENVDSAYLAYGGTLYRQRCASCHFLPRIEDYDSAKWVSLVDEYSDEAKLTPEEKRAVLIYVLTELAFIKARELPQDRERFNE